MVVSKFRSSASLTVITPVAALMANGRFPSPSPLVLPAVMDHCMAMSSSPVLSTSTTVAALAAVSARLAEVSVTDADVGDRDRDVLGVGGGAVGGPDGERVARGRLEVEVVGVVDGDRAGVGADGERQLAVGVAVGVSGGDGPGEARRRPSWRR